MSNAFAMRFIVGEDDANAKRGSLIERGIARIMTLQHRGTVRCVPWSRGAVAPCRGSATPYPRCGAVASYAEAS